MAISIAVINHSRSECSLTRTILDGLSQFKKEEISFYLSSKADYFPSLDNLVLKEKDFIEFARQSDFIFLIWGKDQTYFELAGKINRWHKTVFIDGSELGKNNRYDFFLQKMILDGNYSGNNKINQGMLKLCQSYFRREKPYIDGIVPLPYGIESKYSKHYNPGIKKDIDFFCVFGQDECPLMRKYARELLTDFCDKNNFSFHVSPTKTNDEFYRLLARSKVGISVGGGGYDTFRFWEILANNCLLFTEKIDIYEVDSDRLDYKRIWQFGNLYDFVYQLEKIGNFLKNDYYQDKLEEEYQKILKDHSTVARIMEVLNKAKTSKNISITDHMSDDGKKIKCGVCGSSADYFLEKDSFSFYKCTKCDLVFVYPQPSSGFLAQEIYSQKSGYQKNKPCDLSKTQPSRTHKQVIDWLDSQDIRGKILDVGCSNGEFLYHVQKLGFDGYGVELNEVTSKIAKKNGLKIFQGELKDAGFEDEFFDVVFLGDILEHVSDPHAFLLENQRVLKKDGLVIISTPNLDCFWSRITFCFFELFKIPWSALTPPAHLFQFSKNNLDILLSKFGFSEVVTWYNLPPTLKYELGSLHLLKRFKKSVNKKEKIKNFFYMVYAFSLYSLFYFFNQISKPLRKKDFSLLTVFKK